MKIIVTFGEILESGCWEKFCEDRGYNPWIINEGLAEESGTVELTLDEAKKYNIKII